MHHPHRKLGFWLGLGWAGRAVVRWAAKTVQQWMVKEFVLRPALASVGMDQCTDLMDDPIGTISPCINQVLGESDEDGIDYSAAPTQQSGGVIVMMPPPMPPNAPACDDLHTAASMPFCEPVIHHPFPADLGPDRTRLDNEAKTAYDRIVAAAQSTTLVSAAFTSDCKTAFKRAICLDKFPTCDCNYMSFCVSVCQDMNACHKQVGSVTASGANCSLDCDAICSCPTEAASPPPEGTLPSLSSVTAAGTPEGYPPPPSPRPPQGSSSSSNPITGRSESDCFERTTIACRGLPWLSPSAAYDECFGPNATHASTAARGGPWRGGSMEGGVHGGGPRQRGCPWRSSAEDPRLLT